MIHDPELIEHVGKQTEAFNSNAPLEEKIAILEKIQKRQAELRDLYKD
jgi:hypothetical protein